MHINQINAWADFWRNSIGVNVIPANSVKKMTWINWSKDPNINMQTQPIPQYMHDEWKHNESFKNGMAIICGKVLHIPEKSHLWLCAVDCDNRLAIDEMTSDLADMSQHTVVEQHLDNPNKAHFYFYTTKPMQKKSSDSTNVNLKTKMDAGLIPAIEMKGEGQHGIMYCTPSPHRDGTNYEIIGTKEPAIMDEVGNVVLNICKKYNLGVGDSGRLPMKLLMDPETKIHEGHNRHEALMRYAESILRKYPKMLEEEFDGLVMLWNNKHCDPPLSDSEVTKQKKCAVEFIQEKIAEEERIKKIESTKFGTMSFWSNVDEFVKVFRPTGLFIKCLDCRGLLVNADPMEQKHYGHKVILI